MNLLPWRRPKVVEAERSLTLDEWISYFTFNGVQYGGGLNQTLPGTKQEPIGGDFRGLAVGAYKRNGVVFACMQVRMMLFSEARFQFRQIRSGRPGDLFGNTALTPLEHPWPGGTTGDLLIRAIQDHDLAGNWFCARRAGGRLERLRPDWVVIVAGSEREDAQLWDVDTQVIGYAYQPGGPGSGRDVETFLREEVAHFATIPDPEARFRGMSWLTPVIDDILSDGAMTAHKQAFFENGATPNLVVKFDRGTKQDDFDAFVAKFKAGHEGAANAFKTLFLGGGADATVVGSHMEQIQFKEVQGAGETRICMAASVPPVIVGASEGLESATYSNYAQATRRLADGTMRPLWRNFAGSVSSIIDVPSDSELWYDDRDIAWLKDDVKDAAEARSVDAQAMATLVKEGWEPDSVVDAITAGDLKRLKHSGALSVQLQKGSTNGNGAVGEEASQTLRALAEQLEARVSDEE